MGLKDLCLEFNVHNGLFVVFVGSPKMRCSLKVFRLVGLDMRCDPPPTTRCEKSDDVIKLLFDFKIPEQA